MKEILILVIMFSFVIIPNFSLAYADNHSDSEKLQTLVEKVKNMEKQLDGNISNINAMIIEILGAVIISGITAYLVLRADRRHRIKQEKLRKEELEVKVGKCLRSFYEKQHNQRTSKWLKIDAGFTDDEFIEFLNLFRGEIVPAGQNDKHEPLFKIKNKNEFLENYADKYSLTETN